MIDLRSIRQAQGRRGRRVGLKKHRLGSAAIEWLAAAPIVLLLGLGVLQWGLVFFSRSSLEYALTQAAREGAQGNALVANIESGLARGLIAYWGLGAPGQSLNVSLPSALLRVNAEKATGALMWRQISPTDESFTDWSVPARDAMGEVIASVVEIPNDALQYRKQTVGASSGQTLKDANLLKLEMRYGITLNVPLVAPLAVRIMEQINGCPGASSNGVILGTVRMTAASAAEKSAGTAWPCTFYRAKDASGVSQLRWPVQTIAMVRMQTPARKTGATASRKEDPLSLAPIPSGAGAGSPENSSSSGRPSEVAQGGSIGSNSGGGGVSNPPIASSPGGSPGSAPASGNQSGGTSGGAKSGGATSGGATSGGTTSGGATGGQSGGQSGGQWSGQGPLSKQELLGRIEQDGQNNALEACSAPAASPTLRPG